MSEIDIRDTIDKPISKIVFSDEGINYVCGTHLKRGVDTIKIVDEDDKDRIILESKEQTENLIKALQKAIELGWVS